MDKNNVTIQDNKRRKSIHSVKNWDIFNIAFFKKKLVHLHITKMVHL